MKPEMMLLVTLLMVTAGNHGCGRAVEGSNGADPGSHSDASIPEIEPDGATPWPDGKIVQPGGDYGFVPQQCTSSTITVDSLEGASTATSLATRGSRFYTSYWRCSISTSPSYPVSPCSGLRFASDASGKLDVLKSMEKAGIQGMGTALRIDAAGTAHVSGAGPLDVSYGSFRWDSQKNAWHTSIAKKVGASYYSSHVRTWMGQTAKGQRQIAWARLEGGTQELKLSSPHGAGWTSFVDPLLFQAGGLGGLHHFMAAYDRDGGVHKIWIPTQQTIGGAVPKSTIFYTPPYSKPTAPVAWTEDALATRALHIDEHRRAHMLFLRWTGAAQAPTLQYVGERADGTWNLKTFPMSSGGMQIPDEVAITTDGKGQVHVAVTGSAGMLGERLMIVASLIGGTWTIRQIVKGARGAVDIAVDDRNVLLVSYFTKTAFKVARICS